MSSHNNPAAAAQNERKQVEVLMGVLQAELADKLNGETWGTVGSLQHVKNELLNLVVGLRLEGDESENDVRMDVLMHVQSEVE